LTDPKTRRKAEAELCHLAHVPDGSAIIDIPLPELLVAEPRITKTDVKVLVGKRLVPFSKLSPLANALKVRDVAKWVVMVAAHPEHRDRITKVAERVLFR
jgi:HD superfamily phosphohydrolase